MIVTIEDSVFISHRTEQLRLLGVLRLGFEGRHRLQIEPPYEPGADHSINRWLARQSEEIRDEVEIALEYGLEADVYGVPCDLAIRVADVQEATWTESPPRLPLDLADEFLKRPLGLLVENRRNDGAFLRTVAPGLWRAHLEEALNARWIEFIHGGGLSEMQARVEEMVPHPEESMRLWVLFDSDAREPGKPSERSEALRQICQRAKIAHHQLRRRENENYLPAQALSAWTYAGPKNQRASRRRKASAFTTMTPEQRHFFNMKHGFKHDRPHGIPGFYGRLAEHRDLQDGFGTGIAALYRQERFRIIEDWLLKDGQQDETLPMIQAIFRWL